MNDCITSNCITSICITSNCITSNCITSNCIISVELNDSQKNNFYRSIIRIERNKLLNESDKYLLSDYPITSNNLVLIKYYREELRNYMNLPEIYINSSNIILPIFPVFPF